MVCEASAWARSAREDAVDPLARESRTALAERLEALGDAFGEELLFFTTADLRLSAEVPVVLPIVEEEFVEGAHIARPRMTGIRFARALHVRDHAQDLFADHIRRVGDADDVVEALGHLRLAIGAFHDGGLGIEHDLRLGEDGAVSAVEPPRDLASELDMGGLVAAHRDDVALDDDD